MSLSISISMSIRLAGELAFEDAPRERRRTAGLRKLHEDGHADAVNTKRVVDSGEGSEHAPRGSAILKRGGQPFPKLHTILESQPHENDTKPHILLSTIIPLSYYSQPHENHAKPHFICPLVSAGKQKGKQASKQAK